MADFAKWATACELAFAKPGSFSAAYQRNRTEPVELLVEEDLIADTIRDASASLGGGATELLEELKAVTGHAHVHAKNWPKDAKALSGRLRRLALSRANLGSMLEALQDQRDAGI